MKMVHICPDIPDDWKGTMSDVARVLGLNRDTVHKYAVLGRRQGGIDWRISKNGRKVFTGREVKRFWREY